MAIRKKTGAKSDDDSGTVSTIFGLTREGKLTATDVDLTGTIKATSGYFGNANGWTIKEGGLSGPSFTNKWCSFLKSDGTATKYIKGTVQLLISTSLGLVYRFNTGGQEYYYTALVGMFNDKPGGSAGSGGIIPPAPGKDPVWDIM